MRVCVINSFAASNALWQHERHSTACVYYTPMQVVVCVCECVFVCVLACWKPQQSHCTLHTHTYTCSVRTVHKYLHMKFIMLKISQDLKAGDRERSKREREGAATEYKAKLGDPGGVCIMNSNPQPGGNKCHDNLPSPSSPAHLARACRHSLASHHPHSHLAVDAVSKPIYVTRQTTMSPTLSQSTSLSPSSLQFEPLCATGSGSHMHPSSNSCARPR